MQERIILFDLDGTLTDSGPGIMKASQFALHAYGVERDWQELDFFVGPPLDETFGQFMPKEVSRARLTSSACTTMTSDG